MDEYIESGVRLAWLIDPVKRDVHVYEPGVAPRVVSGAERISGEPVLPGSSRELTPIWD